MTENKARKSDIRQRMAETGEPYSVARHAVEREHSGGQAVTDSAVTDSAVADGAAGGTRAA